MKTLVSVVLAVYYCIAGLFATAEIRLNPDKYNYVTLTAGEIPEKVTEISEEGFAELSQITMHYQVCGTSGKPLILLHGNGGNVNSMADIAAYLAADYKVYVIESRCHGRSSDPGVIDYDLMADDVYDFINVMGLDRPAMFGHSDGAIVGISLASRHPDALSCLIAAGANSSPEAAWFQFRFWVHWENLLEKDKLNDLMAEGPHFTEEFLSKITIPVYVVSGDGDLMPVSDTLYIHKNIKNSDMNVFRGEDHGSYLDGPRAYTLAKKYFDKVGY